MKKRILSILLLAAVLPSCTKDDKAVTDALVDTLLGYSMTDNVSTVPTSINLDYIGSGSLPSSVDLTPLFPPVGDQGRYGTCVAWASAYYLRTAVEGIANNYTSSQLANPAYQLSPKDLFMAIPDSRKGGGCNGTNFDDAMAIMQNRGVATMATVPYNLTNCSQSNASSSWASDAAQHKIKSYRKVAATVTTIKQYLANNVPIVFGARIYDNFMSWNSSEVLSYNGGSFQGGHALTIVGYNDAKGPNGAFKIVNSWNTTWGANGFVWIDYNFFVNEFAVNGSGQSPIFVIDNGTTTPSHPSTPSSVDLAAYVDNDYNSSGGVVRQTGFDIFNVGASAVSSSTPWSIVYLYYNAYNANDYGIIFEDDINTTVPAGTVTGSGNYAVANVSIPSGSSFGQELFGTEGVTQTYAMPAISGQYYLVLVAAPGDPRGEPACRRTTQEPHPIPARPHARLHARASSARPPPAPGHAVPRRGRSHVDAPRQATYPPPPRRPPPASRASIRASPAAAVKRPCSSTATSPAPSCTRS